MLLGGRYFNCVTVVREELTLHSEFCTIKVPKEHFLWRIFSDIGIGHAHEGGSGRPHT
jgi:hypothetical protein